MNKSLDTDYSFMELLDTLRLQYVKLCKEKDTMPDGSIFELKKNGHIYYYQNIGSGANRKQRYLSRTNDSLLISSLNNKKNNLKPIKKRLEELHKILVASTGLVFEIYNYYKTNPAPSFPVSVSEKDSYRMDLKYRTQHGEIVRSKSEVLISNALLSFGVPYAYEKGITINGKVFCPDFTIRHPLNGRVVYLEHLGIETKEYGRTWEYKKTSYASIGIVEGNNLFTTKEEDISEIDSILSKMFTYRRYNELISFLKTIK